MSMTVFNQAAISYSNYSLLNSSTYQTYSVDASELSKERYNVSGIRTTFSAMTEATDSANLYSIGKIDSFVKSKFDFSQIGTYEDLNDTINSYGVSSLLNNDSDLSELYSFARITSQLSADYMSSLLESNGYVSSAVSNYTSYLEDASSNSVLDVSA